MPLFELFRMAKGKLDPDKEKPAPSPVDDASSFAENDFADLAWQNGQVVMQGQCNSRDKRSFPMNTTSVIPHGSKFGTGESARAGRIRNPDGRSSEFPACVPSAQIGLNQEDDTVPWMNYSISGSLNNDYCSDFLPELAGVTNNQSSLRNNFGSVAQEDQGQLYRDSLISSVQFGDVSEEGAKSGTTDTQLFQSSLPLQTQTPLCSSLKLQRAVSGASCSNSSLLNLSYSAKPTAIAKNNTPNSTKFGSLGLSGLERVWNGGVDAAVDVTNGTDSNPVVSSGGLAKAPVPCYQTAVPTQRAGSRMPEVKSSKEPETVIVEDALKADRSSSLSWRLSETKGGTKDGEKTLEPVVGSSSIGSGNSAERASDELKHGFKRKSHETDESEDRSDDVEEELVSSKKKTTNARENSSRKTRAAEVHNMSERRRRDRINEKMRALQELIPNSNKVDKASMFDEAIEYIKTLKLHLQMISSMGAGLCMPAMVMPTGMQPMGHMPHFQGMGMGMGMARGLEFGMGILHMNMLTAQFPGPNLSMYGVHGPGVPLPMPHTPVLPFSSGLKSSAGGSNIACRTPGPGENQEPATVSCRSAEHQQAVFCPKQQLHQLLDRTERTQSSVVPRGVAADSARRKDPGPRTSVA